jgi:hypothetical protein
MYLPWLVGTYPPYWSLVRSLEYVSWIQDMRYDLYSDHCIQIYCGWWIRMAWSNRHLKILEHFQIEILWKFSKTTLTVESVAICMRSTFFVSNQERVSC